MYLKVYVPSNPPRYMWVSNLRAMNVKEARRLALQVILDSPAFRGNKAALARSLNMNASYLGKILKEPGEKDHKGIGEDLARDIEHALGLTPGHLDIVPLSRASRVQGSVQNLQPEPKRLTVPLISWVQAGSWGDVSDPYLPGQGEEIVEIDTVVTGNAFALTVEGDSMTSPYPGATTFPNGTTIVVDPGRAAQAGDYVVAKNVGTQGATFKQLTTDGARWFLKPLNPAYPTYEIDDPAIRVIGKVVESVRRDRF
jgi:SOS-response transcriptional repressor LexA